MAERYVSDSGSTSSYTTPRTAPVAPPPPKKVYRPKKKSSGGGQRYSSSGNSSGSYRSNSYKKKAYSGGGSNQSVSSSAPRTVDNTSKVVKPPAPPKPAPPSASAYLKGDTTYQRQMAAYAKALADYQADQSLQRTDYDTGYLNTKRDIGLAKTDALGDLENDYAARGLLRSSLYNTDVGKLNQEYQNQYTDLDKQRTSFLDQLTQALTGFKSEQGTSKQSAYDEALRRRAEKYGL